MIVATAATLCPQHSSDIRRTGSACYQTICRRASRYAIAIGIFNAGFMGIVIISLSTAYAFSEFRLIRSLDTSFNRSKTFYLIFLVQLVLAGIIVSFPNVSLFHLVIGSQVLNAMMLPFVFYYLLKLTNNRDIMGNFVNKPIQRSLEHLCCCYFDRFSSDLFSSDKIIVWATHLKYLALPYSRFSAVNHIPGYRSDEPIGKTSKETAAIDLSCPQSCLSKMQEIFVTPTPTTTIPSLPQPYYPEG